MYIRNEVGLEGEFLVRDSKGGLLFPSEYGFSTDEFLILGEFRAKQGSSVEETVGNFFTEIVKLNSKALEKRVVLDFSGHTTISPVLKKKIMSRMGVKPVPTCKNIYGTEIIGYSDDVIEDGKIVHSNISCGLHVHFSRRAIVDYNTTVKTELGLKLESKQETLSLITPSQIRNIVRAMDTLVLPKYRFDVNLKYRMRGFYEEKFYGFEYRSLPFVESMTNVSEIKSIVDIAFNLLKSLEK